MQGDKEIKATLSAIDKGLLTFAEALPDIERNILKALLHFERDLQLSNGNVSNSLKNIKALSDLQATIERIVLDDKKYGSSVKEFAKLFEKVTDLNFKYFKALEKSFKPNEIISEVRKQAVLTTISGLTEAGISHNLAAPLAEIIKTYVTTGGSYASLANEIRNFITGAPGVDGALTKYAKTYTTDAINQHAATVNNIIASDLGWSWFKYIGSNIKTTRTFCKALTQKKFYHISELPQIIKGNFSEFKAMKGQIYDKTELPQGMYEDTNTSNFFAYRGGWNCGHQSYAVPNSLVPKNLLLLHD